jgi:hypothetical protein
MSTSFDGHFHSTKGFIMKTTIPSIRILFFISFLLVNFSFVQSQTAATVTWALTSNGNASASGAVSGSAIAKGSALGNFSYDATTGVSTNNWSDDAGSLVSDEYYEYKVSPSAGKNFTLNSIEGLHSRSSGNWQVAIYYSTNGWITSAQIGSDFSINSPNATAFSQSGLSIPVYNGVTLTVRIYAWESDKENRQYRNKSIVLNGTTTDCVSASITTNPNTTTQTTCLNLSASTLSVAATGSGLSYQWYKSTSNSNASGTAISGATSSTFAPIESTAGTYYYYCQVVAACGVSVKSAVSGAVTVANTSAPSPSFTSSPGNSTALNTNVTYSTQSGAGTYFWTVPGVSGTDYSVVSGSTSSNSITLKWLRGGSKFVTVNYTNASGCQGAAAASSLTFVPETLNPGAYIINMGASSPTVSNSILPYGLIFDLIRNHSVPVRWVINQEKTKDGIDFTHNGVDYKGGTFVIPAESRTAAVNAKISSWVSRGVVGATSTSTLTINYAIVLSSSPTWTINSQNADITVAYLERAGINLTDFPGSYNFNSPASLGACNDLFVMPHADPTWAQHSNLLTWNQQYKGSIWAACHAASAIENLVNPANKSQQMNFLTQKDPGVSLATLSSTHYANSNSLVLWGDHNDGTPPYTHRLPNDPIAQYMGTTDAAQQNGSEQIYLPRQAGGVARWNAGVNLISYDPTQADVVSLQADLSNAAAAIVYGRGFDDANRGWVMYEGGHDHDGTAAANIAALRAFFNFSFFAAKDKVPAISTSGATTNRRWIENSINNSFQVSAYSPVGASFTYQWSSNAGGTFSNPSGASTTFSAPDVEENTPAVITCSITDGCGRVSFLTFSGEILYQAPLPVTLTRFEAKKTTSNTVALSWTTASEASNKGFRIERQVDNNMGKFESIGFVGSKAALGNSQVQLNYAFTDEMPVTGKVSQYRLAQIDLDGKTTYSELRIVRIDNNAVVTIFPNPTSGALTISRTNNGKKMNVQVVNQQGRIISESKGIFLPTIKINISESGIYTIKIVYPETGEQSIQRVVVQK